MKLILLAIIYICGVLGSGHKCESNFTKEFNWNAGGIYGGYGSITFGATYPVSFYVSPSPANMLVNPEQKIVFFNSSAIGFQFVTENGFFYANPLSHPPLPCLADYTYSYDKYVTAYEQARNVDVCCKRDNEGHKKRKYALYSNLVVDGGTCGNYGSVTIKTDCCNRVKTYVLFQTLFNPAVQRVSKSVSDISIDRIVPNDSAALNLQSIFLASGCVGAPAGSYCGTFYPPGHDYTLEF